MLGVGRYLDGRYVFGLEEVMVVISGKLVEREVSSMLFVLAAGDINGILYWRWELDVFVVILLDGELIWCWLSLGSNYIH